MQVGCAYNAYICRRTETAAGPSSRHVLIDKLHAQWWSMALLLHTEELHIKASLLAVLCSWLIDFYSHQPAAVCKPNLHHFNCTISNYAKLSQRGIKRTINVFIFFWFILLYWYIKLSMFVSESVSLLSMHFAYLRSTPHATFYTCSGFAWFRECIGS